MTCQTDDPEREAAHLAFVRDIEPKLKPLQNEIRSRYLDSPHRAGLPKDRYHVFDRAQENRRALYREANIPRETELAELDQQYQKIIGAMTVTFQGQERTPAQMAPFLEETDRSLRQEAWELVANRRLADREALDDLFDRMVRLRVEVAREAGFDELRRLRLPGPRAVRLRRRRRGRVPGRDRARGRPARPGPPGGAPAGARGPDAPAVGPGGRPHGAPAAPPLRTTSRRSPRGPRPSSRGSTPSSAGSSPTSGSTACSTWPTARGRPPAATRRRSKTTGSRSSS